MFHEFLQHAGGDKALRAVISAAADGHILVNAVDPQVDAAFRSAGAAGALPPPTPATSWALRSTTRPATRSTTTSSATSATTSRSAPTARATSTATVRFDNEAPADAEPGYVFGPFEGKALRGLDLQAGEAYQSTSVYCGIGCTLSAATRDGEPYPVQAYREGSHPLFVGVQRIPPQSYVRGALRPCGTTDAWTGNNGLGTYRLTIRSQPTLNPTTATISIRVPDGMSIAYASEPMKVQGGVATWSGELVDVTTFEVRFQRDLVGTGVVGIDDFLSKPVIRL